MSMKSWVLHRVQGLGEATGRADLPSRKATREPGPDPDLDRDTDTHAGNAAPGEPLPPSAEDLGAYSPLIGAVRDELEHFVASHVRLHVVIADRDRFMLTAVGVRSPGGASARQLLREFLREFRPEQVKRYLAREVIGRLPNAAVIDLSQFAGLSDLEAGGPTHEAGEYEDLISTLRTVPEAPVRQPYEISVLGRWTENDASIPTTRLAGRPCEFDIDDGDGPRRAALNSVVPGHRYIVGKGDDCDIRVNGTYTSRRHAELWMEGGTWHVADAGSTNGFRVESAPRKGTTPETARRLAAPGSTQAIALREGMRIVLSARAEGPPVDYPWIALRPIVPARAAATVPTPIAAAASVPVAVPRPAPSTPRTAVLASRRVEPVFEISELPAGARVHAFRRSELPITIGRSRGQSLVIDWSHAGVSGHHVEIDAIDDDVAHGVVRGDNGIDIGGTHLVAGDRLRWLVGQTMVLGGSLPGEPQCQLALARRRGD
jgi:pSer/pThr/pTyr-binding forkhead associated (FHA) protein